MSVITLHCTFRWSCVTMSTATFYSLSTVCQYLTLHPLLVLSHYILCHYVHRYLLHSVHWLSVRHTEQMLVLCHYVYCCLLESSTVCRYVTLYRPLVLCLSVHCCIPQSVLFLSVPHTVHSFGSVSLYPLLSSTFCPLSVSTSHCTVPWFCVTVSTAVLYSLFTTSIPFSDSQQTTHYAAAVTPSTTSQ